MVHLSDIHFGRTEEYTVRELIAAVNRIAPDLVAVSGDLTQRARISEFEQARRFLDALPEAQIVVPGNHDVPLHNVYARFRYALDAYRQYITDDLEPVHRDEEIVVLGMNTARSLTIKGGRINQRQLARIEETLGCGGHTVKILVTHHPFDLPEPYTVDHLVGRAREAMARLLACGLDLLLAGHLHVSYCGPTALRYGVAGHSAIFAQAGTACSTRERGEPNSFNVIRVEYASIQVDTWSSSGGAFEPVMTQRFRRAEGGWSAA